MKKHHEPIKHIPGRVFLDTCVVNFTLDYAEQIQDCVPVDRTLPHRVREDVEALKGIFATGQRAFWQFAISPYTYKEVMSTRDASRIHGLESWFLEIWGYWREFLLSDDSLRTFGEAEETRIELLSSRILDVLPELADRVLICDAIVYQCDAFCTRDWSTILRHREDLEDLAIKILTPTEWWAMIRSWAGIWC